MKTEELFALIDGIDDDIILDIPCLNAEKPKTLVVKSRHIPFRSIAGVAACFICTLAIGIFAVTKIQGGITESRVTSSVTANNSDPGQTSEPDYYYDNVFKQTTFEPSTGAPMTYDQICEMLMPDPGHAEWDVDSFYMVETVRALPDEEAQKLKGRTSICEGRPIYEVKLLRDLISGEEVSRTEKILVAHGTAEFQTLGDPTYAPGERFTVVLTKPREGSDILYTPSSITFRYDIINDGSGTTLYSRGSEIDKLALPGAENINEQVITSTTRNPAIYTQKIGLDELASFLRSDWEQRGLSSHFEGNSNSGNENPTNSDTSQAEAPNTYFTSELASYSEAKELIKFIDVKEPSYDDDNGIHGYEIEYIMPSKTPCGIRLGYTYGEVVVRDNSLATPAPSYEHCKRIEYKGRVFWKDLSDDLSATVVYISDDVSYTAIFIDETQAMEKIMSLL